MSELSEVVDGGTSASAVVAPDASIVSAPVEEGGGSTRRLTSRMHRANSQVSSPLPKEGGTYESYNMNRLTRREIN